MISGARKQSGSQKPIAQDKKRISDGDLCENKAFIPKLKTLYVFPLDVEKVIEVIFVPLLCPCCERDFLLIQLPTVCSRSWAMQKSLEKKQIAIKELIEECSMQALQT